MPYNRNSFGIVVSRLRSEKGISQERFSAMACIARSHLTALENGQKVPRLDTFFQISEALEVQPSDLMKMIEQT